MVKSSYLKDIPLIDFDKDDELNSSPKILGSYTLEELIKGKKIKRDDNGNPILDANGNEENDKIPQFMFTDGDDDATKRAGHLAWFKISDGGIGSTPNILSDGSGLGINTDNATVLNNYSLYVNGKTNLNGDTVINPTNGSKNYTLEVKGTTNITGATSIGGDVTIGGKTNITGATTIGGTLTLTGGLSNKLIFGARNKNYSYEKTATTYNGKETINIQVARWGTSEPSNTENPGDFIGQLYIVISN